MPDYIYLLERRLSPAQRNALRLVRDAARTEGMTSFLTGGAVRDLTSGHPVRDFDVTVQGNALNLRQSLESAGFIYWGSHAPSQTLFLRYPGGVRLEVSSARKETFPKPAHPVYEWTNILEDLRRRDFTVNAMALSLNEGSYGLLMDPTNGVADIEMRTLRLVSNYGFLEDPIRLLRAVRLGTRLAWQMDERTKQRFDNAIEEGVFALTTNFQRGYELEEIAHEENPLEMLKTLEQQGWMKQLFPAWTASKADSQGMAQLHELQTRLQIEGIYPDISAAAMELLTARMQPKDIAALKKMFVRPGFVKEWERLDKDAEAFAAKLTAKEAGAPSASWKLLTRSLAEPVLWLGLTGKGAAIQNKYKNFFSVWPEARQKVPTALMLEMRITPEIERYPELLEQLVLPDHGQQAQRRSCAARVPGALLAARTSAAGQPAQAACFEEKGGEERGVCYGCGDSATCRIRSCREGQATGRGEGWRGKGGRSQSAAETSRCKGCSSQARARG